MARTIERRWDTSLHGSTPPYNSVCNGYGQSCYLAFKNCSTVKGLPGTWNPDGYTPCQNQYRC